MSPDDVQAAVGGVLSRSYGECVVDVPLAAWVEAVTAARDVLGLTLFDLLTAIDLQDDGFAVVLRLWSTSDRTGLRMRTRCPRDAPAVPSVSAVFAGADWHERQTAELFGLSFSGHPNPVRLLLSDDAIDHPLRKDVVLAARVATPWPGVKEPGESDADVRADGARPRRKNRPLGVPAPGAGR